MCQRGHKGSAIPRHRAIAGLRLPLSRLLSSFALALGLMLLLLQLRPAIEQLWASQIVWWMQALQLPGQFEVQGRGGGGAMSFSVPFIDLQLGTSNGWAPLWHGTVALGLWWAAGRLPDAAKPLAYMLRFATLIHGVAVLFFTLWPASFPHSVDQHVGSGLRQAWHLMLLAPWIQLATYYLFPFALWQRALLTILTWAFLVVLTPLQYSLHIGLIHQLGMLVMPLLNLLFGVMLAIIGFVALYGWAMAWRMPGSANAHA